MRHSKKNTYKLFWLYIGLFSNLDLERQAEGRLLSYKEFKCVKNKEQLIDLYRNMLYNGQKK